MSTHALNQSAPPLQIRAAGAMWRIYQGDTVLAFASTYRTACQRLASLEVRHA